MTSFWHANRNRVAAALAMLFGVAVIYGGSHYPIGRLGLMGPGYLPVVIGIILVLLGAGLLFESSGTEEPISTHFRAPAAITAALVAFGLLIGPLGLVPATVALVAFCALGESRYTPVSLALLAVGLCAMTYLIFVAGLGLSIPLFRFELR